MRQIRLGLFSRKRMGQGWFVLLIGLSFLSGGIVLGEVRAATTILTVNLAAPGSPMPEATTVEGLNGTNAPSVTPEGLAITSPLAGQAVQGVVSITGSAMVEGGRGYEVEFGYANDETSTWFLISEGKATMKLGVLAEWDTTTISDGDYDLRLSVVFQDSTKKSIRVGGVRVRNYTPIETVSAGDKQGSQTRAATNTPGTTPQRWNITRTPLPQNPAEIRSVEVWNSVETGMLVALVVICAGLLIQGLRSMNQ